MKQEKAYTFTVGQKIKFASEKQAYTIRACDNRYLICTKPFNVRKTVLYTIVDLQEKIRGPENLVFGFGAETDAQCQEMLDRLYGIGEFTDGVPTEISHRHRISLDIELK